MHSFDKDRIQALYDDVADIYRCFYDDYATTVHSQGKEIAIALQTLGHDPASKILDCSCGVGTQAIGLSLQGYNLSGIDLSPASIDEAKIHAKEFEADVSFSIGDMMDGTTYPNESFDAIISLGNTLAHFLQEDELDTIFANVKSKLKPGAHFLAALTDHRFTTRDETTLYDTRVYRDNQMNLILFQLWDWIEKGKIYRCNDYLIREPKGGPPVATNDTAYYRIWTEGELNRLLSNNGFKSGRWIETSESGHHNPIFTAQLKA